MRDDAEQLAIKSPEYEQAIEKLYSTATRVALMYGERKSFGAATSSSFWAERKSDQFGRLVVVKRLPQKDETLEEWLREPPSITRTTTAGMMYTYEQIQGLLKRQDALNDGSSSYGPESYSDRKDVSLEEIEGVESALDSSEPFPPKPEAAVKKHRSIGRRILRRN